MAVQVNVNGFEVSDCPYSSVHMYQFRNIPKDARDTGRSFVAIIDNALVAYAKSQLLIPRLDGLPWVVQSLQDMPMILWVQLVKGMNHADGGGGGCQLGQPGLTGGWQHWPHAWSWWHQTPHVAWHWH